MVRAAKVWMEIGADTKGLDKGLQKLDKGTKQAERGLGSLATTAGALFGVTLGAYGLSQLARTGIALGKLGAESLRMKDAFATTAKFWGGDADKILAALKKASGGAIAETELMLNATRAMEYRLGADSQKLGDLMEVTRFRAMKMGLDFATAWDRMVLGIGRKSKLILDDLGIVGLKMTETTNTSAIMDQVIAEGQQQITAAGGIPSDYLQSFEKLDAAVADLKTSLGELLAPTVAAGADWLSGRIDVWTTNFELLHTIITKLDELDLKRQMEEGAEGYSDVGMAAAQAREELAGVNAQMEQAEIYSGLLDPSLAGMNQAFDETGKSINLAKLAMAGIIPLYDQFGKVGGYQMPILDHNVKTMAELSKVMDVYMIAYQEGIISLENYTAVYDVLNQNLADHQNRLFEAQKQTEEANKYTLLFGDALGFVSDELQAQFQYYDLINGKIQNFTVATIGASKALQDWREQVLFPLQAEQGPMHPGVMSAEQRRAQALEQSAALAESHYEAIVQANKDAADDFNAKMQGANTLIAGDVADKVERALGIGGGGVPGMGGERGGAFDMGDAPGEWWRRLADVGQLGEGSPWAEGMRDDIAKMADWALGEGAGAQVMGDEGAMRAAAREIYEMAQAGPGGFAGFAGAAETGAGIITVDWAAAKANLEQQRIFDEALAAGFKYAMGQLGVEGEGPTIPVQFSYGAGAGGEEGEAAVTGNPVMTMLQEPIADGTLITKSEELGNLITTGIWTGLAMEGADGATGPLVPLLTDLQTAFDKLEAFKSLWDNLDDKTLVLLIKMVQENNDEYQTGGIIGGMHGSPVPILAHAGEMILNRGQQYSVAGMLQRRAGGGEVHVHLHTGAFLGHRGDAERLGLALAPHIKKAMRIYHD